MDSPRMPSRPMVILHVEDHASLARVVRAAFQSFGFEGQVLNAHTLAEATEILAERERTGAPLDLILLDMQLPDGSGMDLLEDVRSSATWNQTPVIVLSGDTDPDVVNQAYALGANCYLPKDGSPRGMFGVVQALHRCWMEEAVLPQGTDPARVDSALTRAIRLRARTAKLYLDLAHAFQGDVKQERFWIERSMAEGNHANLLAFFRGRVGDRDVPADLAAQVAEMQQRIAAALTCVSGKLKERPPKSAEEACAWVLDVIDASDEEVVAAAFGALCPKGPTVTCALRVQAAAQMRALASHVYEHSKDPALRWRADAMLAFSARMERAEAAGGGQSA